MKIWIKLLLGSIIGILLGVFLSFDTPKQSETLEFLITVVIHVGRYILFGLVFFSLAMGTHELREEKKAFKVYGRTLAYMIITTLLLVLIGTLSVVIFPIERIPIIIEEDLVARSQHIRESVLMTFPKNFFRVFITEGNFLFPVFLLAVLIGFNFNFDKITTRPAVAFFDSMSRIIYNINSFVVEIIGLGIIILAIGFVKELKIIPELGLYKQILIILIINTGLIIFGIYPALLYFVGKKENPYRWLYGMIAPAITAFFSRDSYFTLTTLMKHGKENLGIPRKTGTTTMPLFAMFGKAGTAMVTAVSFVVVLVSYSSLGISLSQFLWVILFSFLFSFTLSAMPGMGVLIALSSMCALYGRGIEEGYLVLGAIIPVLTSFGVFIDIMTAGLASVLIAKHEDSLETVETADFI